MVTGPPAAKAALPDVDLPHLSRPLSRWSRHRDIRPRTCAICIHSPDLNFIGCPVFHALDNCAGSLNSFDCDPLSCRRYKLAAGRISGDGTKANVMVGNSCLTHSSPSSSLGKEILKVLSPPLATGRLVLSSNLATSISTSRRRSSSLLTLFHRNIAIVTITPNTATTTLKSGHNSKSISIYPTP